MLNIVMILLLGLNLIFNLTDAVRERDAGEILKWNERWCVSEMFGGDGGAGEPLPSDGDWCLVLVNRENPLEADPDIELKRLSNGHAVDRRIYPQLQQMMDDARAAGLSPVICSSYRTVSDQQELYSAKVEKYLSQGLSPEAAEAEAAKWVALPGTSEHHTGLAVDIVSLYYQTLDEGQENTAEQKWLMENSWRYGFILRYPNGTTEITGINYEPWHYRYVGKTAAEEIYTRGITLEEYLGEN